MNDRIIKLLIILFLIGLTTCKKPTEEVSATLTVNPTTKEIDANTGNFNIAVSSTVAWTASCDKNWITLVPMSGSGNGTVKADFLANASSTSRTANIIFKGSNVEDRVVTVTQSGIQPILTVTPTNLSVAAIAGSSTINITSNLSWSVTSNQTWCSSAQPSGIGNAALTINYQANTTQSQRTAIITFSANGVTNQTVQITQAEFVPILTVTPQSQTANSPAGTASFTITSNIAWTASCEQSWCIIQNPNGSNNGTLIINYQQNTTSGNRDATIKISGIGIPEQSVTLTQTILIPTLSVTPQNRDVTSQAGTTTFDILSNTSWAAQSNQTWCTINNPTGSGNKSVIITYEANTTSSQRVASIIISVNGLTPTTVTVTQQSNTPPVNVASANYGATATATSSGTYQGITHYPSYVNDGDNATFWASDWECPAWVKVEFNQLYIINKIVIWWSGCQHTFSISLSQDNITWTEVIPYQISSYNGGVPISDSFDITPITAKFIKCSIATTNAPSSWIFQSIVDEIEAYK